MSLKRRYRSRCRCTQRQYPFGGTAGCTERHPFSASASRHQAASRWLPRGPPPSRQDFAPHSPAPWRGAAPCRYRWRPQPPVAAALWQTPWPSCGAPDAGLAASYAPMPTVMRSGVVSSAAHLDLREAAALPGEPNGARGQRACIHPPVTARLSGGDAVGPPAPASRPAAPPPPERSARRPGYQWQGRPSYHKPMFRAHQLPTQPDPALLLPPRHTPPRTNQGLAIE